MGDVFLAAIAGLSIGAVAGLVVGEWVGDVDQDRVRRGLKRLSSRVPAMPPIDDLTTLEQLVTDALRSAPDLYIAGVRVEPIGPGTVELIGWTEDERGRERLGAVASDVPGVTSVINRVLVQGVDDAPPDAASPDTNE